MPGLGRVFRVAEKILASLIGRGYPHGHGNLATC
jgi:hypothetical protein